jgi:hypothetical protein
MSKSFYKKSTKNPKPTFFSVLFYHVFGLFTARGCKNTPQNINKYVTLLCPTHPPQGPRGFFVSVSVAPCACAAAAADLGHVAFFALTIEQPKPAWAVAHGSLWQFPGA